MSVEQDAVARLIEPRSWAALGLADSLAHQNRRTSSLRKAGKILDALDARSTAQAETFERARLLVEPIAQAAAERGHLEIAALIHGAIRQLAEEVKG